MHKVQIPGATPESAATTESILFDLDYTTAQWKKVRRRQAPTAPPAAPAQATAPVPDTHV